MAEQTINDVVGLSEQELLKRWAVGVLGANPADLVSADSDLGAAFRAWCQRTGLTKTVCVDFRYCERKKGVDMKINIAAALGDFLFVQLGHAIPFTIAALFVQYGFDSICECDRATEPLEK